MGRPTTGMFRNSKYNMPNQQNLFVGRLTEGALGSLVENKGESEGISENNIFATPNMKKTGSNPFGREVVSVN